MNKNKLKDEEFKKSELEKSKVNNNTNDANTLATSKSDTKYLYKKNVLNWVDSMDNSFNWSNYLSTPLTDVALGAAIKAISKSNFIGWAGTALSWSAAYTHAKQEEWWKDSAIMILKGKITGVKITITPNINGNYPKVYKSVKRF